MAQINFQNKQKVVTIHPGGTILQAAQKGRVLLNHRCGGKGSCTTCKVVILKVLSGEISNPSTLERRMIGEKDLTNGERLGCQVKVYGNIVVTIPDDRLKEIIRKKLEQIEEDDWL